MNAYAVYFVDSYGYMQEEDVLHFIKKYDLGLNREIRIGFHAHNNMNLAYANALKFINSIDDRNLIVDSCLMGMGQGAGNLQTELITHFLNNFVSRYIYSDILECCEIIEKYTQSGLWGYSVSRLLPALHKAAYKYSVIMREKYHYSYNDINKVFNAMPKDLKQRYTPENLHKAIEIANIE